MGINLKGRNSGAGDLRRSWRVLGFTSHSLFGPATSRVYGGFKLMQNEQWPCLITCVQGISRAKGLDNPVCQEKNKRKK